MFDHGLQTASDAEIWNFALRANAVIVTKDEDFAQFSVAGGAAAKVVWLRFPNMRTQPLLAIMASLLPDIIASLERGEMLVEVI